MLDGSDAMNPDPDYSAAYAVIHTSVDGLYGHGMTFTISRGNELAWRRSTRSRAGDRHHARTD
jgi:hypothetical protein